MKRSAKFVILIVVLFVGIMSLHAQSTLATPDFTALETLIADEMATQQAPGLVISILYKDEIIYEKGFGVRDIESNAPVTPNTLFRIGSTTKPLTVIGILQQVEQGTIDLDVPIVTYIPEFAVSSTMTLRQVLSMTAGLSDEAPMYGRMDVDAATDYVLGLTPKAQFTTEGEVFSYANPGYAIAGLVLERVTDMPYADYMEQSVFPVLGMDRTTFYSNTASTYPLAVGYDATETGLQPVRPNADNAAIYAAGFAYSTVGDLARLGQFLMNDGVLDDETIIPSELFQEMITPIKGTPDNNFGYGLGTFGSDYRGTRTLGHDGGILGFSTILTTLPEYDLAVSVIASNITFQSGSIFDKVVDIVLELPADRVDSSNVTLTDEQLAEYVGVYQQFGVNGELLAEVSLTVKGGQLLANAEGIPTLDLSPESEDVFNATFAGELFAEVPFTRNSDGEIAFMVVGSRALIRLQ